MVGGENKGGGGAASLQQQTQVQSIPMPARTLSVEFFVGLFAVITMVASSYLAVGLGDMEVLGSTRYEIFAEFDSVSGLKPGASVEIAGVQVGTVTKIELKESVAMLTLAIDENTKILEDDQALIRTKGIIGDRYVKISRGASVNTLPAGGIIKDTTSVVDIEDLLGKFMHSMDSKKEE
jgi:phospholipid/cholesterol/gamma-HCH transport system substrate-binding protein